MTINDKNGNPVTIATDVGRIGSVSLVGQPSNAPTNLNYPNGWFSYSITVPPGSTAHISFTMPTGTNPTGYEKCTSAQCFASVPAFGSITGNIITLTIQDGGPYDADGMANGVITDPGAPSTGASGGYGGGGGYGGSIGVEMLGGLGLAALLQRRRRRTRARA